MKYDLIILYSYLEVNFGFKISDFGLAVSLRSINFIKQSEDPE